MASSSKLTQDCKPFGYSLLLKSFGNQLDQSQKLEEFLSRLEEEWLKIEAFKRELPLCMQLLSNAMEDSRQQLQTYQANQGTRPVLEEFIPLKNSSSEESDRASSISEKASWMVSAQLWSQSNDGNKQQTTTSPKETNQCLSPKLGLDDKKRNGGAFLPFSKERNTCNTSPVLRVLPELALASSEKDMDDKKCSELDNNGVSCSRLENSNKSNNGVSTMNDQVKGVGNQGETQSGTTDSQTHRKARRCWSPDLHRRFLNALQMLGGSQVATPKQIRELMKVDGLTNDEVKSHLQKYRLHTRRPSHSPQAAGAQAPQLVVLGSIWMPPEYATAAAHNGGPAMYSAHPASLASPHYCTPAIPQDFYPAPPLPPHHQLHHHNLLQHHHHLHHQMYKDSTQTHSSPDSDLRGGGRGDRSESIEDGKSDSGSWKGGGRGDSGGENGSGERRGLASLRDEAENTTTNGNEIILKF